MSQSAPATLSPEDIQDLALSDPSKLEEALYGSAEKLQITRSELTPPTGPAEVTPEPQPPVEVVTPEPAPAAPAVPEPPAPPAAPEPASPAAPTEPIAPAAPADPTEGWSDVDRRAFEIKQRNPDLTLEEASERARRDLGVAEPDPNAQPPAPEPTTAERLAEIERQLDEAGATEGLLNPEIINLQKEHSRLSGQLAVENRDAQIAEQAAHARLVEARTASRDRVVAVCQASGQNAQDPASPIGQAIAAEIAELRAADHPDIYAPNAPELILARANLRLPAEQRIAMTIPSPAPSATPPNPPSPQPAAPAQTVTPSSVLPASAAARSAHPATTIDPSNVRQVIKETSVDTLEESLYGKGPVLHVRL